MGHQFEDHFEMLSKDDVDWFIKNSYEYRKVHKDFLSEDRFPSILSFFWSAVYHYHHLVKDVKEKTHYSSRNLQKDLHGNGLGS